jgi:hypothetical protein
MTTMELLTPEKHSRLRVRRRSTSDSHFVQIIAAEFEAAAACCPVLFTKNATTGGFYVGAMFGFKEGESLLDTVVGRGGFEPLVMQCEGFFVSGDRIAIDVDNSRFSESEGELLFAEDRTPEPSLRAVQHGLGRLRSGIEQTEVFIKAMSDLKLIEPIDISLSFEKGERLVLRGLYTVSLDSLREIDDAAVVRLFRSGHLHLAYAMRGSLRHISRLADLRNRRLSSSA